MAKVTDDQFEELLRVLITFAMGEVEEITPFDSITPEEHERIFKLITKTLEVTAMVTSKFFIPDSLDTEFLSKVHGLIKENRVEEAAALLNKD